MWQPSCRNCRGGERKNLIGILEMKLPKMEEKKRIIAYKLPKLEKRGERN